MAEQQLEHALVDLGRHLAFPPTPDLSTPVRRRLSEPPTRRAPIWANLLPLQRRLALALVALLFLAAGVLAVWPQARSVVAERLGLRGVQIIELPPGPTPTASSFGVRLNLGQRLTLEEAQARVSYQVKLPSALGVPDEVYLLNSPPGGQVALVYAARTGLPAASTTGVGLLLTEFEGSFQTGGPILKGLPAGTNLVEVSVNGGRGYWIDGDPHLFFYQDAQGRMQSENTRLAANVLLWEDGPLTLRLESALTQAAALNIATSVR